MRSLSSPRAVSIRIGSARVSCRALTRLQSSTPETDGSIQSRMMRSGFSSAIRNHASSPVAAWATSKPSASKLYLSSSANGASSSTISTLTDIQAPVGHVSIARDHSRARLIILWAILRDRDAMDEVVDALGDVGRVIADTLDVLGAEQKMGAEADVARILHHVGQELAKHRIIHGIDLLILAPDREREVTIAFRVGVKHVLEPAHRTLHHAAKAGHDGLRVGLVRDGKGALGRILGKIADALQIRGDAQRRHDVTKVIGHGLPTCDHRDHLAFDIALELVDRFIRLDHRLGELWIALLERIEGVSQRMLGEPAHLRDPAIEQRQLFFV